MYKAYLIAMALGVILTPVAIHAAYVQRGCFAFGGEYLLPVLFVLVVWVADMGKETLNGQFKQNNS